MSTKPTPTDKARVLLIGSGGVGTIAAYALESGGRASVTAVCRSNYRKVTERGFTIDSFEHGRNITGFRPTAVRNSVPNRIQEPSLDPYDYIVVTTKNIPDIPPSVVDIVSPAVTPGHTAVVLLQNGLNIERPFLQRFPTNPILSGISLIGVTEVSPGVIRHDGRDRAYVGVFPHQTGVDPHIAVQCARHFVDLYNASGAVQWEYEDDVLSSRWRKLVYNASFNSVAALLRMDTARMRMSRHVVDDLIRPTMLEIMATAKAAGARLPEDIHETFIRIDPPDAAFVPSMGQDAAKGNFIEMETIVGEPLREAERLGVATPTLRTIYGLLRGVQLKAKEARGLWRPVFEEGHPYR